MKQTYIIDNQVFCTFEKKQELISVAGKRFYLPHAAVISEITHLPDSFFDEYQERLCRIETAILDRSVSPIEIVSQIMKASFISESALLDSLILFVPAFNLFTGSSETLQRIDFSMREINYLKSSDLDDDDAIKAEGINDKRDFLNSRIITIDPIQTANESYYQLIRLLSSKVDLTLLNEKEYCRMFHILDAERDYVAQAKTMLQELKRIHDDFAGVRSDSDESVSFYRQFTYSFHVFDPLSSQCPFHTKNPSQPVYTALSFIPLVSLELYIMQQFGKRLLRCSFCDRLFSSYSSRSKYCAFPNPKYEGETCRNVAPHIDFINRECSTTLGKEYRKNYEAYNRWVSRNQKSDCRLMKLLYSLFYDTYEGSPRACKQYAEQEIARIQADIKSCFKQWVDNAKIAQENFLKGKISEEEVKSTIQLPPVSCRSTLLSEKRAEMKEY